MNYNKIGLLILLMAGNVHAVSASSTLRYLCNAARQDWHAVAGSQSRAFQALAVGGSLYCIRGLLNAQQGVVAALPLVWWISLKLAEKKKKEALWKAAADEVRNDTVKSKNGASSKKIEAIPTEGLTPKYVADKSRLVVRIAD